MTVSIILSIWLAAGVLSAAFLSRVFTRTRAMEQAQRSFK